MTGPAFSSVSLRIMSPDGKTVLGELQQIDRAGQRAARNMTAIGANTRKSVSAVRTLAFAASGLTSGLTGAVNAAGNLAEGIALSSRNAKVAAGAAGIGALAALLATLGIVWKGVNADINEFNTLMNKIGDATDIAKLRGIGPASDVKARREAIEAAGRDALAVADKLSNEDQKKAAREAIFKQTREEILALEREITREREKQFDAAARDASASQEQASIGAGALNFRSPIARAGFLGRQSLGAERALAIADMERMAADRQFSAPQIAALRKSINDRFDKELEILEADLAEQAQEVGNSFVGSLADSISDGIATAISSGSLGEGFKALTGGILVGFGGMLQTIGTQGLLASKLVATLVKAIASLNPGAAIGASLGLIALGGLLKGIGASMGGGGAGGGFGGAGGSFGRGSSFAGNTVIDRGLINPLGPAPNTVGLRAVAPVTMHNTFFGSPDDPRIQRYLLTTWDRAQKRRTS